MANSTTFLKREAPINVQMYCKRCGDFVVMQQPQLNLSILNGNMTHWCNKEVRTRTNMYFLHKLYLCIFSIAGYNKNLRQSFKSKRTILLSRDWIWKYIKIKKIMQTSQLTFHQNCPWCWRKLGHDELLISNSSINDFQQIKLSLLILFLGIIGRH